MIAALLVLTVAFFVFWLVFFRFKLIKLYARLGGSCSPFSWFT